MARNQFRVDLGYGEIGISSHLFLNDFAGGFNSLRRDPYAFDVVDTLSDQFSALSLLRSKLRPIPIIPSNLQPLRPHDLSSVNNISNGGPKADQILYGGSPKLPFGTTDPFYELHLSRFRKNESQQDRARALQRQEAWLKKVGLAHRNGNVLKESVGTGVFHPLQRPTSSKTVTYVKKRNQRNRNQSEKRLMTKERRGVMTTSRQQQQQQDECHYYLPSDMDFSKDWTF